jgi:hypothetical protein
MLRWAGLAWLLSTHIPLMELALHHQALALKVHLVAKARDAYGYFCKASQMNKVPGRYWKPEPDLSTSIQQHSKLLNPQPVPTPVAHLILLSSEAAGGILLVTQQFAPDGTKTEPYITGVAVPSFFLLGKGDENPQLVHCTMRWDLGGSYIRRVRICGTLAFCIHSAPDLSLFCDVPPVCIIWANLFPLSHFSFQMTSFPFGFLFQCTLM